MVRDLPLGQRPRERLVQQGAEALSAIELIALLLGSGTRGKDVLALSSELMIKFQTVPALLGASLAQLRDIKGIGMAKAIQIQAAFELAKRAAEPDFAFRYPVLAPEDVYRYAKQKFHGVEKEQMVCIYRDSRGFAFAREIVAYGQDNCVYLRPKDLFQRVLKHYACSFVLCHNHPTGDPTPSPEDRALTLRLERMGKELGLRLDDHLVMGSTSFVSLYRENVLQKRARY